MELSCCHLKKLQLIKEYIFRKNKLMDAVFQNDIGRVNRLIKSGVNIDYKSYYNWEGASPLMLACYKGYYEIVKILINNGADVNFTDNYKRTPFYNAIIDINLQKKNSNVIKILELLIQHGAKKKNIVTSDGRTPLLEAINEGDSQIVRFLLQHGLLNLDIDKEIESGWFSGESIIKLAQNKPIITKFLIWYNNPINSAFYYPDN